MPTSVTLGQARQHAGMVAAHHAGADDADAQLRAPGSPVFASDPDPLELILSTPTDYSQ